ncbi:hypothetical protein Droror1_Dr00017674 [Drosera rotundifolia]
MMWYTSRPKIAVVEESISIRVVPRKLAIMAEARSQQVASMTEFHWLGRRFPISNAKTRVMILKGGSNWGRRIKGRHQKPRSCAEKRDTRESRREKWLRGEPRRAAARKEMRRGGGDSPPARRPLPRRPSPSNAASFLRTVIASLSHSSSPHPRKSKRGLSSHSMFGFGFDF